METRHKDCLPCRLVSGSGIIGIGLYLFAQSQKHLRRKFHKYTIAGMSVAFVGVGIARLFDLIPSQEVKLQKDQIKPEKENVK